MPATAGAAAAGINTLRIPPEIAIKERTGPYCRGGRAGPGPGEKTWM